MKRKIDSTQEQSPARRRNQRAVDVHEHEHVNVYDCVYDFARFVKDCRDRETWSLTCTCSWMSTALKDLAGTTRKVANLLHRGDRRLLLCLVTAFCLCMTGNLPAQKPEKPENPADKPASQEPVNPPQGFRIGVRVDQVYLSVNVRSLETGGFVRGLKREEFRILEDGVSQEITNFNSEAVPVHVALLLDTSGSVQEELADFRRAILSFVKALTREDKIALVTFSDQAKLILNWTSDPQKIELAAKSVYSKGRTVFYDALYVTFDDLLKDVSGKKAVIVFTDGIDTASSVDYQQVLRLAVKSEAMVYFVSKLDQYAAGAIEGRLLYPFEPSLKEDFINRVRREIDHLSAQTGGAVLNYAAMSLTDIYARVAEELRNQYYIGYQSSNPARDGAWRKIEIDVLRPGVRATTRAGYYAPNR
ncbi:MAG TPA: VWA domain-containing protein [Acidobacteriota bacterium]